MLAAVVLLGLSAPAQGDVIFTLGNNPQPDEENILLNSGATGTTVLGTTQTSNLTVSFSSTTDTLTEPSGGQARVESTDGAVNNITISIANGSYTDLILNPFKGNAIDEGPATVTVVANDGTFTFNYPSPGLNNGNNFLTITTSGGETILSTTIDSTNGFNDLRQPRISGAALNGTTTGGNTTGGNTTGGNTTGGQEVVPEPTSLLLWAALGLGLAGYGIRRQRRTEPTAHGV